MKNIKKGLLKKDSDLKNEFKDIPKNKIKIIKPKIDSSKYINISKFLTDDFPVTFILGARGVGKTITSLSYFISKCYDENKQFIYLRRYQTEIDELSLNLNLLSDLTGHVIAREVVKLENGSTQDCITADDEPVCILMALSTSGSRKSNAFPNIETIVYDEFIDMKGRELKGETNLFLNFAMTVFREFDKYHALFLANATNLYNNYFLDLEVMPRSRITKFRNLGIKIVMYKTSAELDKERLATPLAKQVFKIEGENGSSLSNEFDNEYDDFIRKLSKTSRLKFNLTLNRDVYGVWQDIGIIISKKHSDDVINYAMTINDLRENQRLLPADYFQQLNTLSQKAELYYTDVHTRSTMIRYFKSGRFYEF